MTKKSSCLSKRLTKVETHDKTMTRKSCFVLKHSSGAFVQMQSFAKKRRLVEMRAQFNDKSCIKNNKLFSEVLDIAVKMNARTLTILNLFEVL